MSYDFSSCFFLRMLWNVLELKFRVNRREVSILKLFECRFSVRRVSNIVVC